MAATRSRQAADQLLLCQSVPPGAVHNLPPSPPRRILWCRSQCGRGRSPYLSCRHSFLSTSPTWRSSCAIGWWDSMACRSSMWWPRPPISRSGFDQRLRDRGDAQGRAAVRNFQASPNTFRLGLQGVTALNPWSATPPEPRAPAVARAMATDLPRFSMRLLVPARGLLFHTMRSRMALATAAVAVLTQACGRCCAGACRPCGSSRQCDRQFPS